MRSGSKNFAGAQRRVEYEPRAREADRTVLGEYQRRWTGYVRDDDTRVDNVLC